MINNATPDPLPIDFLAGSVIWIIAGVAFWLLRKVVLRYSIDIVEKDLNDAVSATSEVDSIDCLKKLSVLRSLDAIVRTTFYVSFPFAMILLGMIIPAEIRGFLKQFVTVNSLIGAGLAATFGYFAVFTIWQQHMGPSARTLLEVLLKRR